VLALFRTPSDDLRYIYHRDETLAALDVVE
jgi:hypothetical protein